MSATTPTITITTSTTPTPTPVPQTEWQARQSLWVGIIVGGVLLIYHGVLVWAVKYRWVVGRKTGEGKEGRVVELQLNGSTLEHAF